ncbi:hypothetical protein G5V59_00155 [Nocardioides sp. W3-2-3]|uniref:hypothetical protein n=1 Tax=Nocardioides convexus TaxID=2712224 RepID=UPI002418624E|nr:hypothetical protein [Nocardioides convexus]NGZ99386.1 hypothetical protein [Nocardioides convexus]
MSTTAKGAPFPETTDTNDAPARIQALAQWVDARPGVATFTTDERNVLVGTDIWPGRVIFNSTTGLLEINKPGTAGAASLEPARGRRARPRGRRHQRRHAGDRQASRGRVGDLERHPGGAGRRQPAQRPARPHGRLRDGRQGRGERRDHAEARRRGRDRCQGRRRRDRQREDRRRRSDDRQGQRRRDHRAQGWPPASQRSPATSRPSTPAGTGPSRPARPASG